MTKSFAEYTLVDHGWDDPNADPVEHLETIEGRDNVDQKFIHNGVTGYPENHVWMFEGNGTVLALFDGTPDEGGVEIAEAEVLDRLISSYGFPLGTTLGEDGKPIVPADERS